MHVFPSTNLVLNILFLNVLKLTPEKMSCVHNLWNFFYFDIFHGIFLPTKITVQRNVNVTKPFWQKESIPEPRGIEQRFDLSLNPVSKSVVRHVSPFMQEQISVRGGEEGEIETIFSQGEDVSGKTSNNASNRTSLTSITTSSNTIHLCMVEIH